MVLETILDPDVGVYSVWHPYGVFVPFCPIEGVCTFAHIGSVCPFGLVGMFVCLTP